MAEISNDRNKRCREDEEQGDDFQIMPESPEAKRIREALFYDVLEEESEPDTTDLFSVMKSLEEELLLPVSESDPLSLSDPDSNSNLNSKQPDLGFLIEASDDELGLPPAEGCFITDEINAANINSGEETTGNLLEGKIWGISDDFQFDFGLLDDVAGGFESVDVGAFDYGEVVLSDLTC